MGTGQVTQARRDIDRVAITVSIDELHLATRHTHPDRHPRAGRRVGDPFLVSTLHLNNGANSVRRVGKDGQSPIAQRFDDPPTMRQTHFTYPLGELSDYPGSPGIANGLKHRCAAHQVCEHDGRLYTHSRVFRFLALPEFRALRRRF